MKQLKNIIVTGSNKGIGYGIVDYLAKTNQWNIIMACRNIQLGNKAKSELIAKYPHSQIHVEQLDVSNPKSIESFIPVIKQKYHQIDVLVNNAGVAAKGDAFDLNVFEFTFATNFYGTIELTEKILPLLTDNGKIVTLGSMAGKMTFKKIQNEDVKKRYQDPNLTKEELFKLADQFKDAIDKEEVEKRGWARSIYGTSKLSINLYCKVLSQREDVLKRGIQVYVCCPGYVATDMTSHKGFLTVDQGIKTPVYLIELPFEINKQLQGEFFQNEKLSSTFVDVQ